MPTIDWQLVCLLTGLMLFAYWSNYVMGQPLAQRGDPGAILFVVPYTLAVGRLKRAQLWAAAIERWREEDRHTLDARDRATLLREHRWETVETAQDLFTWERSLLCPVCAHFWLTAGVAVTLVAVGRGAELPTLTLAYLVNHLIIRKI